MAGNLQNFITLRWTSGRFGPHTAPIALDFTTPQLFSACRWGLSNLHMIFIDLELDGCEVYGDMYMYLLMTDLSDVD